MGGESKTSQTQSSTTAPWQAAQPALTGILDKLNPMIANSGPSSAQTSALNQIESNAGSANQFVQPIMDYAKNLLNGGGATDQAGNINQNYQNYQKSLSPFANGSMVGANSGLQPYLDTIRSDVSNQVNGQFAGAGRDLSGLNMQALGRGVAQGQAPVIAAQYNQDINNQRGAQDAMYNAGNTNSGLLAGLQQQKLGNQAQGITAAGQGLDMQNAAPNAILQAEAQRTGIPIQQLGLLAQLGIPIAQLGSQSTGQSNGTNQMSGAQQFNLITSGIGSMMPKGNITFGGS